jgi:diguanylate cyclase (GGDEF)-like protein
MPRIDWRPVIGPAVMLVVAGVILALDQYLVRVPNPGAISLLVVAFSGYLGGIPSGLASAAISLALAAVSFSIPGQVLQLTPDDLARMLILLVCTPATAVMTGVLQSRAKHALEHEGAASSELRSLRAALDQSAVGVVLLDADLRAQFINRAYRRLFRLPEPMADGKPTFIELMHHARDTQTYRIPAEELDAYISERTALVRAGDERPVDIRLADGDVIRFRCKALSDGGRMLSYGNVSDLVRMADELAQLATIDPLTGIHNRRHFVARLDTEWNRYRRYGRPFSLLVLDIDHFKAVNDNHGHDVGDQAIVSVARLCRAGTRESDLAARIGGEEFAILLPETDIADACVAAERLRNAIAARPVPCRGGHIAITVSIGVAAAGATTIGPTELMKHADEALYAAKRAGRNCVTAATGASAREEMRRSAAAPAIAAQA